MNIIEHSFGKIVFPMVIVVSRFNEKVTDLLCKAATERLEALAFPKEQITFVKVPGAVEIPITAQRLAKTGLYEAIVCLGTVIRGETNHYDYVCSQVSTGCQKVALEQDIPVIFGVLTTNNEEQALARVSGTGKYAVDAALEMVAVLREIERQ